jgi:hypothetical protein
MPKALAVPRHILPAFIVFRDTPVETLQQVADGLSHAGTLLRMTDLQAALVQGGAPSDAAKDIGDLLLSLASLRQQQGMSTAEAVEAITSGLTRLPSPSSWNDQQMAAWATRTSVLKAMLDLDVLYILEKAIDLRYEHQNVLMMTRVITDVRPVFARSGVEPRGAVVTQTLRLEYVSDNESKSMSLVIDEKDLKVLLDQARRAIDKAKAVAALD